VGKVVGKRRGFYGESYFRWAGYDALDIDLGGAGAYLRAPAGTSTEVVLYKLFNKLITNYL